MLLYKIKILFKRKRHNKSRYSADKVYVSRAELKHFNNKIIILLYTYNKKKASLERYLRKILLLIRFYKFKKEDQTKLAVKNRESNINLLKSETFYKKKSIRGIDRDTNNTFLYTFTDRSIDIMKDKFFVLKK